MQNLNTYIELYGEDEVKRMMEISSPISLEVFLARLYFELGLIIQDLEAGRKERGEDGEDRLSIEIVACLKSAGYLAIKDPTHGGHVDIFVSPKRKPEFKWYAEAKIWGGVEYLEKGMTQLLSRYATGREKNLGFLVYFKEANLVAKMQKWKEFLEASDSVDASASKSVDEFTFCTAHHHDSGSLVEVRHMSVNIYWNPK